MTDEKSLCSRWSRKEVHAEHASLLMWCPGIAATPDVPEQVELPSEPGAILDGLLWAMCGNTDGELIDGNSEIPAGEMYRLAVEFLKPVLAALVPAGSEREAALAAHAVAERIGIHVAAEYEDDPHLDRMILELRALVPEAEEEKA